MSLHITPTAVYTLLYLYILMLTRTKAHTRDIIYTLFGIATI